MHRTTLALDDQLFRTLKKRAAEEDRSLQDLVDSLLRQALRKPAGRGFAFEWKTYRGKGVQPGVDLDDTDRLLDWMEGR